MNVLLPPETAWSSSYDLSCDCGNDPSHLNLPPPIPQPLCSSPLRLSARHLCFPFGRTGCDIGRIEDVVAYAEESMMPLIYRPLRKNIWFGEPWAAVMEQLLFILNIMKRFVFPFRSTSCDIEIIEHLVAYVSQAHDTAHRRGNKENYMVW